MVSLRDPPGGTVRRGIGGTGQAGKRKECCTVHVKEDVCPHDLMLSVVDDIAAAGTYPPELPH